VSGPDSGRLMANCEICGMTFFAEEGHICRGTAMNTPTIDERKRHDNEVIRQRQINLLKSLAEDASKAAQEYIAEDHHFAREQQEEAEALQVAIAALTAKPSEPCAYCEGWCEHWNRNYTPWSVVKDGRCELFPRMFCPSCGRKLGG